MKQAIRTINTILIFSPIRLNLIWVVLGLFCIHYLKINLIDILELENKENIIYIIATTLLDILFKILLIGSVVAITLNLILWFSSYLLIKFKRGTFNLNLNDNKITTEAHYAIAPFLGNLIGVLKLSNNELIYPIVFTKNNIKQFKWKGATNDANLKLPYYKTYNFTSLILNYKDFLGLMQFPIVIKNNITLCNTPQLFSFSTPKITPIKTSDNETEIKSTQVKEGDILHYKDYEYGDDIRRIVWKVYAKTNEFIVRIPEKEYEYTQDSFFYLPFIIDSKSNNSKYSELSLSYLKYAAINIFHNFSNKATLFLKDAEKGTIINNDFSICQQYILDKQWHNAKNFNITFQKKTDNIIILHSGLPINIIESIISQASTHSIIYWIPLQNAFYTSFIWNNLKRIFFIKTNNYNIISIKNNFQLSALKKEWIKKEKQVEIMLLERGLEYHRFDHTSK
jgi:hypothetical protein